jgi:hypothetical protein
MMNFNEFIISANDNYTFLKKFAKRSKSLCGIELSDLTHLRYKTLKRTVPELFISEHYEVALYEILKDTKKNITFGKVKRADNFKKYAFLLWVQDQYEVIKNLEQTYLSSPPDMKLLNAGIRGLDVLGDVSLIDNLAGGDILKWDLIIELPYSKIFDKQLKNTIEHRISKKLNEKQ